MKIKAYKCKCGKDDFFFADKGNQKGIYCSRCGKWFKWADKDEQNLAMKQVSLLDKAIDEIEELETVDESVYDDENGSYGCWEVPFVSKREVVDILRNLMAESEE